MRDLVEKLFVLAIHGRAGYHQTMQIVPAGDRAVLIELGDVTAEQLHATRASVEALPGVIRATPGHSSLYVVFTREPDITALRNINPESPTNHRSPITHSIPITLTGEDLDAFLAHANLTRETFLARLPTLRLVARYLGFRAGFAYLDGWPEEWAMPRRATSRPVAAGSFAIAGNVAGFYPIDTPGGWNILGHTDADLKIAPGDEIRITVVHDVHAPLAVWTTDPFDDVAASIANAAVGNDRIARILECPLVGPRVRFASDAVIAWCPPNLDVRVERVRLGEERDFGRVTGGLRGYLAIGATEGAVASVTREDRLVIRASNGPHDRGLSRVECEVTPQLDRVGIRLRPLHALGIDVPADLKSIGMQVGTIQLHPDGSLVAMGPDHPVTGGYLQPMTVLASERWKLAQLVPGERVTFMVDQLPKA